MLDDTVFDGALAYLKKQYAAGTSQSPWKISKTIQKACEALGEKLETADIDIILEEAGELTEEKLASRLLLRRVSGYMDRKAYQWLLEEYGSGGLETATVNSMLAEISQSLERKLTKDDVKVILEEISAGTIEIQAVLHRVVDMALSKKALPTQGSGGH